MSSRTIKFAVIALCYFTSTSGSAAIIYNVTPRHSNDAAWSITGGSIITDGTIGEINFSNFLSWEFRISTPAGESIIASDDGIAFMAQYKVDGGAGYGQTSDAAALSATDREIVVNPEAGLIDLFFANQDPFASEFTGQAITFLLGPSSAYLTTTGPDSLGSIIDNQIDSSMAISPIGYYEGIQTNPNVELLASTESRLVLGSVSNVPEPNGLVVMIAISTVGCIDRKRRMAAS